MSVVGPTTTLLFSMALASTQLIVLIIGLGLAIAHWSRYPRIVPLVASGVVLALLGVVIGSVFTGFLPILVSRGGLSARQIGPISIAVGLITRLLEAVAWVLVLIAVFTGRPQTAPAEH